MSRRSDILDALATVFGSVSTVIRASVITHYEELKNMTGDQMTGMTTTEVEDVAKESYRRYDLSLPVTIERVKYLENNDGWVTRQAARTAAAESMLSDLIDELGAADPTLSGLCDYIDYGGGNVLIPDEASYVVGAYIVVRARYQFSLSNSGSL